jgi:hypothetical protein
MKKMLRTQANKYGRNKQSRLVPRGEDEHTYNEKGH